MKSSATTIRTFASLFAVSVAISAQSQGLAQTTGQTRNDLELPDTDDPARPSLDVRVERDGALRPPCPFEQSELTVSLSAVDFRDARGTELAPELSQSLSRVELPTGTRPLRVVCDIRDAANQALREDGWIATIQVPQQDLESTLRLDVISARISEIRISGDPGPYRNRLTDILQPLQELDPLNERDAERILLNANDIPGLSLRLALAPAGGEPGEVIGNLSVDFERYTAFLNARNYNAKAIGRETGFARFEVYGLTGLEDASYIAGQTTADFNEQFIVQGGHEFGLGLGDIRIAADVAYALSRPDIENLDLETDTLIASLRATYPLIRTPRMIANASLGFDYVEQSTDVLGNPLSKDAIRTVYLRSEIAGEKRRIDGSIALAYEGFAEVRQGLGILGATEIGQFGTEVTDGTTASRPFGNADALVLRAAGELNWFPGSILNLRGRVEAQWTDDPLLNYDEYSIGNLSIGRGYDPGANSGDRAIGGLAEVGATVFRSLEAQASIFGFFDIVQVENLDRGTPDPRRTLKSVGGGVRFSLGDGLRAEVAYAEPLDRALFTDDERPPARVLFSITTKFPALFR